MNVYEAIRERLAGVAPHAPILEAFTGWCRAEVSCSRCGSYVWEESKTPNYVTVYLHHMGDCRLGDARTKGTTSARDGEQAT